DRLADGGAPPPARRGHVPAAEHEGPDAQDQGTLAGRRGGREVRSWAQDKNDPQITQRTQIRKTEEDNESLSSVFLICVLCVICGSLQVFFLFGPCSVIACFISRTARSIPTSTARDTMLCPMFNSSTPAMRTTGCTFQ